MNFQFLKYFVVLAEELHFGRAAEKLSITQPPLSLAIKNLEEELGVALFHRSTKKVELTKEGFYYLGEVRQIMAHIEKSHRDLHNLRHGFAGTLTIGLSPSLSFRGVLELFTAFEAGHPKIHVTCHEMPLMEQLNNLKINHIDLGFCNSAFPIFEFHRKRLKSDTFCLCVYAGHPLYNNTKIDAKEIDANELIAFERAIGPSNYDLILRICGAHAIRPKFIVRTWANAITFVSLKKGLAIVPQSMSQLRLDGIRYIPLAGESISASAMMLWNKHQPSASTQLFLDFLANTPDLTQQYFEVDTL